MINYTYNNEVENKNNYIKNHQNDILHDKNKNK